MFVAFYALLLDLFAAPRCSILHLIGGAGESIEGARPYQGYG